jgi:hypothetical protein
MVARSGKVPDKLDEVTFMSEATITVARKKEPGRSRRSVLTEPADEVVAKLKGAPNEWFIIADGPMKRRGVIAQTAHRIRTGAIEAFEVHPLPGRRKLLPGKFECLVSTDTSIIGRTAEVELYARWVPSP